MYRPYILTVKRPIVIPPGPSIAYVPLSGNCYAKVDSDDAPQLSSSNWSAVSSYNRQYAKRWVKYCDPKDRFMHRFLLRCPTELIVDHINGDSLDNRRANLRLATRGQNCANRKIPKCSTTGVKGISFDPKKNQYRVSITFNGKRHYFGRHADLERAKIVAKDAYDKLWGEFATQRADYIP